MGSKPGLERKRKWRFWRWLAVALGPSSHPGACQFGEGGSVAVEGGDGEQGQVGAPGSAHLGKVMVKKGDDVAMPLHRSEAPGVSDGGYPDTWPEPPVVASTNP